MTWPPPILNRGSPSRRSETRAVLGTGGVVAAPIWRRGAWGKGSPVPVLRRGTGGEQGGGVMENASEGKQGEDKERE